MIHEVKKVVDAFLFSKPDFIEPRSAAITAACLYVSISFAHIEIAHTAIVPKTAQLDCMKSVCRQQFIKTI